MNKKLIQKEFMENLYESKGLWMIASASVILTALCIIVVNVKEGAVLAQSDILQYAVKIQLFLSLVMSMTLGASAFISERENNTLESLLLTPVPKIKLNTAKYIGVLIVGVTLILIAIPYLFAIGFGSGITFSMIILSCTGSLILLCGFTAVSILFSIMFKNSKASILISLLTLIIFSFPAFLSGILKLSAIGRFMLAINPMMSFFNLMTAASTEKLTVLSTVINLCHLVVFSIIMVVLMITASSKISLRGEK